MHVGDARLIVITDTSAAPRPLLLARIARILALAAPGTVLVQLRDNALPFRERKAMGAALAAECAARRQWFGVNDRVDLAVLLGAHAVHLGERSIDTAEARRLLPAGTWISRACHDADSAPSLDADAVLLSPIVQARKGAAALGMDALLRARARIGSARAPRLYALGGVDAGSAAACFAAGADGIAVIGAALGSDDPTALLAALARS